MTKKIDLPSEIDEQDELEIEETPIELPEEDNEPPLCSMCNGSGLGQWDGASCSVCRGEGVVRPKHQGDY